VLTLFIYSYIFISDQTNLSVQPTIHRSHHFAEKGVMLKNEWKYYN